ncbi:MAG: flagellar biosynthetic protein FliO [Steroidobacteraceae bacterium]|nr:flagellar biosynthetic protein FliO [Steroidobacteraceae bacterium]MDW8260093.1 flagellar biosynthetic protein FliO [Gammaproteobacteria bacterium]
MAGPTAAVAEVPAPAFAATPLADAAALPGAVQVLGSLMIVLFVIFVLAWLMRRLRDAGTRAAGMLRVAAAVSLADKTQVVLLQVSGRYLLLGVAPGGVTLLAELAAQEAGVDQTKRVDAGSLASGFAALLRGGQGR